MILTETATRNAVDFSSHGGVVSPVPRMMAGSYVSTGPAGRYWRVEVDSNDLNSFPSGVVAYASNMRS